MGLFGDKDAIIGAALGASGAFDKEKKTDVAVAFGAALGASLGAGKDWTFADAVKLGASIGALDSMKEKPHTSSSHSSFASASDDTSHEYDNLILTADEEEQLEAAGIDTLDFEFMDDEEKREALELQ